MESSTFNRIYARTNENGVVIKFFSEQFEKPQATDTMIDSANTERHGSNKYAVVDNNGYYNYIIVNGKLTNRDKSVDVEQAKLQELRKQRESECFSIINRGKLWYDLLDTSQMEQLVVWYKQWLDITLTKQIPSKPDWIK